MKTAIPRLATIWLSAIALAACGDSADNASAEGPQAQEAAGSVEASPSPVTVASALPGKLQFLQCAACHAVEAKAAPKVGPNLHCIIGRGAGSRDDFNYSTAFEKVAGEGLVWDRGNLLEFLEKPMDVVPRNSMAFGGLANADDREAIADYLEASCPSDA